MHEVQAAIGETDQDSLFGSPPPSPQFEGRALFLDLALPSQGCTEKSSLSASTPTSAAANIQNVGTIALPGSQPDSELPIHPLALSLNHGLVPRPPALPQVQSQAVASTPSVFINDHIVTPCNAGPSRPSNPTSDGIRTSGKGKKRRPSQPRIQSEPVTEPTLQFSLPDPSAPPPVHFLRSQENLLGKAGRVGGITTSVLPKTRGSTPSNPILIDDDDDTPMIGRRSGSESAQSPLDPMKLAQPTNEEVVSILVGQKDIFPVLESILKLIAKGAQSKPPPPLRLTGFERRSPAQIREAALGPPAKKRKLNRVPAGALDWDVPFPFADGEGPTAYHRNWERDRGKQLISQLLKLIKIAARKAAAKKYIAQQTESGGKTDVDTSQNIKGYYRPETARYGLQGSQTESGVVSQGEGSLPLSAQQIQATSQSSQPTLLPFQHSLGASPTPFMEFTDADLPPTPIAAQGFQPSASSLTDADKNAFNVWMDILDIFNFDGSGIAPQASSGETTTPFSGQSTPKANDFGLSQGAHNMDDISNWIMGTSTSAGDNFVSQDLSSFFDFSSITPNPPSMSARDLTFAHSFELNDFASDSTPSICDPMDAFFAMSQSQSVGITENLTQPSSPLPSTSSESQAMTPASANWDSFPDIFNSGSGDGGIQVQGMWRDTLWSMFDDITQHE